MNNIKQGGSNKSKNHVDFKSGFYFEISDDLKSNLEIDTQELTDKYIKKVDKLLKNNLKKEPQWKQNIGDFGLSKHSDNFSDDPKIKNLIEFMGQRSYEFLDWQGFDLKNYNLQIRENIGTRIC